MITNSEKKQIFHKMNYDLKGHLRSYNVTFLYKIFFLKFEAYIKILDEY